MEACRRVLALARSNRHDTRLPGDPESLIEFCGLDSVGDRPVSEMSYGQVRLLGIALALAARPRLLMLDEPAAGLNDFECEALRGLLEAIRVAGVTLAVVDHDMAFLLPLCDRMIVLDAGQVVAEGQPREVTRDPHVVAVYLGEKFVEPLELAREER
jgi:ABC-type branched-subunit amino acid transport system ATPase component